MGKTFLDMKAAAPFGWTQIRPGRGLLPETDFAKPFLQIWDVTTGNVVRRFGAGVFNADFLALSPDGKVVAVAGPGSAVRLYRTNDGTELLPLVGHRINLWHLAVPADGQTVATAGSDPAYILWDARSGKELRRFDPAP